MARRSDRPRRQNPASLLQVVTVHEAALMFDRTPTTIRCHCEDGALAWRYTASGRILIDLVSLQEYYGRPGRVLDLAVYEVLPGW